MTFKHLLASAVTAVVALICVSCGESIPKVSDSKEDFHIFLLMGDELMSGRAEVNNEAKPYDAHIVMMDKDGNWVPVQFPIQYDSSDAKARPGLWFARGYAELNKTVKVGLVPCAFSGSLISDWQPGATAKSGDKPFDTTIDRAKKAMESGTLKGALWMQGLNEKSGSGYQEKAAKLLNNLRTKIGDKELPIVMSQLIMDPLPKAQQDINNGLKSLWNDITRNSDAGPFGLVQNREIYPGADGKFMDAGGLVDLDDRFLVQYLLITGYEMF